MRSYLGTSNINNTAPWVHGAHTLKLESKTLPKEVPDMGWAYKNLAKLGGWKDTKRTGRASIKVLWEGWFKLQTILEGYELAMSLDH
ncbi:hypothetical protein M892_00295 [Vibrio campbellii ATCC BAA-1116]|uniref:Uncharacterized protein n=1 Tax=Vibrio campbellii (strain ATCC BAA-1116) TaxID=2902295 RepID=A7MYD0_VIBC1|nr:hypothetical protein VIBHAR_02645 [Vibrio campbellii ATCC BAA-1116]AGU95886.1 hypothetical protein M892_00295 [Vibrio campbellii ATCC BAA-1116]